VTTQYAKDLLSRHDGAPQPEFHEIGMVPGRPPIPEGAEQTTVLITLPPASPGASPHRHPGPAYGYVIRGEIVFEPEGEPERVVRAGETFWEPGGRPMLVPVSPAELDARRDRRAPRPA
jgi:quercetin dioxygenase-like cupin family protein